MSREYGYGSDALLTIRQVYSRMGRGEKGRHLVPTRAGHAAVSSPA